MGFFERYVSFLVQKEVYSVLLLFLKEELITEIDNVFNGK